MKKNNLFNTPILFLIFNRPETEKRVFEQIRKVKPRYLYVAADGPRKDKEGENDGCLEARRIVDEGVDWPCEVKKLYRKENLGCKLAVSSAISWFFENVEEGIILEDDCLPSLSFFKYAGVLLEKYKGNEKVNIISGDNFQKDLKKCVYSYYFSKYTHIWGWATWRRSWKRYDVNMSDWPAIKKNSRIRFGNFIEDKYWRMVFDKVYKGEINTWDYQFTYSSFKNDLVNIMPSRNLVQNIGVGINATHTFSNQELPRLNEIKFPLRHPLKIEANVYFDHYTRDYHYNLFPILIIKKILHL